VPTDIESYEGGQQIMFGKYYEFGVCDKKDKPK